MLPYHGYPPPPGGGAAVAGLKGVGAYGGPFSSRVGLGLGLEAGGIGLMMDPASGATQQVGLSSLAGSVV